MKLYSAIKEFWFGELDTFSPETDFQRIAQGEVIGDFQSTDGMLVKGQIVPMALPSYVAANFLTFIGTVPDPSFGNQGVQGPQGSQGGGGSGSGTQGVQGPQGPAGGGSGTQGLQGPQGLQGSSGGLGWQPRPADYGDNFNETTLDLVKWTPFDGGAPGSTIAIVAARLMMTCVAFPAGGGGAEQILSNYPYPITGDFDIQLSFDIDSLPTPSSDYAYAAMIQFIIGGVGYGIDLDIDSAGDKEYTALWNNTGSWYSVPTSDTAGRLRVQRVDDNLYYYYWAVNGWQLLYTKSSSGGNLTAVVVSNGIDSTCGPVSTFITDFSIETDTGSNGPQGDQGLQGVQGPDGSQGIQGVQGTQGTQGVQGPAGSQGIQGVQGLDGSQGVQGPAGSQGNQGPTGITSNWTTVDASKYTATPASTSQLTMSDTSNFVVGAPARYTIGGVVYYGVVTVVSANSYIRVAGASLSGDVTLLEAGRAQLVTQADFKLNGTFGGAAADLLSTIGKTYFLWRSETGYLVKFSAVQYSVDTGANQPKINVKVNNQLVSTNDTNNGLQLSTAGTWVDNSAVAISTSYYDINNGEAVEVTCTVTGSTKDSSDLTVSCAFIIP